MTTWWRDASGDKSLATAARVSAVLWMFATILVTVLSAMRGRWELPQQAFVQIPLGVAGVAISLVLYRIWRAARRRGMIVSGPVMAIACLLASVLLTALDLTYLKLLRRFLYVIDLPASAARVAA